MSSCLQASLTPIDLNHPILTTFCHQAANILDTQIKMFRQVTVLQQNVFLRRGGSRGGGGGANDFQ